MNNYKFRIANTDEEINTAMDIEGYSHISQPTPSGSRKVYMQAQSLKDAEQKVKSAFGGNYRQGLHIPTAA